MTGVDGFEALSDDLATAFGIAATSITRVTGGTATDNFVVSDGTERWFLKIGRDPGSMIGERESIELAMFARSGGLPVPAVHPASDGGPLAVSSDGCPMSVWDYVADAVTAEGGLDGGTWSAVGTVVGRLHRRLADHPAAPPLTRPAIELRDPTRARRRYDELIDTYHQRGRLTDFEQWALAAAEQRRDLLPRAEAILTSLPPMATQVLHGDLASPNVLLRGDEVAAIVDFQPPRRGFVAWEIARIAGDPRTVTTRPDWPHGVTELLRCYARENPSISTDDLDAVVAMGCAYTLCSTYPLAEAITEPGGIGASLQAYARHRHNAALLMLDEL